MENRMIPTTRPGPGRPSETERGTGTTTKQIQSAPKNAVYVWCNRGNIGCAKSLAHKLGRDDLTIEAPHFLSPERIRGRRFSGIVLDHALDLNREQYEAYQYAIHHCIDQQNGEKRRSPGRPPSGLTAHPVKLYCTDEQWDAYNADRSGMTWSEYIEHLKHRSDKIEALASTLPAQTA